MLVWPCEAPPMSASWVTPSAHATSSPSWKMGTMVWTSVVWTLPRSLSLLQNTSPGSMPRSCS